VAIQCWEDRQAALLRQRFSDWDVWYVRLTTVRRSIWAARIKGEPAARFNASSPDELAWLIQEEP
jgi:hypothetical protein